MMYIDEDALVQAANKLPPLPNTITELMRLFSDPDYRMEQVVKVVELDSSLTGILLRLANSAVYGQPVTNVAKTAIMRLGAGMVKAISFANSVRPASDVDLSMFNLTLDGYWRHSLFVTAFAEEMGLQYVKGFHEEFQTAAVIHDFGKLVMGQTVTPEHKAAMGLIDPALPEFQKEFMVLGVNHAEVTAVVCQRWGLSDHTVQTVQHHHDPEHVGTAEAHGLNLANHLAWRYTGDPRRNYVIEAGSRHQSLDFFDLTDDHLTYIFEQGSLRCKNLLSVFSA